MREQSASTGNKNISVTLSFNRKAVDALKKVGRDLLISGGLNIVSFATDALPVASFGHTLSEKFGLCAIGTAVTAAGITTGRYIGGGVGSAVDAVTHNTEGKYRKAFATAGGTLGGAGTFFTYQSGLWALAAG